MMIRTTIVLDIYLILNKVVDNSKKSLHNLGRSFLFLLSPLFHLSNWSYAQFLMYREVRCRDQREFPLLTLYLPSFLCPLLLPQTVIPEHLTNQYWNEGRGGSEILMLKENSVTSLDPQWNKGRGVRRGKKFSATIRMKGQFLHLNSTRVVIHELDVHTYNLETAFSIYSVLNQWRLIGDPWMGFKNFTKP